MKKFYWFLSLALVFALFWGYSATISYCDPVHGSFCINSLAHLFYTNPGFLLYLFVFFAFVIGVLHFFSCRALLRDGLSWHKAYALSFFISGSYAFVLFGFAVYWDLTNTIVAGDSIALYWLFLLWFAIVVLISAATTFFFIKHD